MNNQEKQFHKPKTLTAVIKLLSRAMPIILASASMSAFPAEYSSDLIYGGTLSMNSSIRSLDSSHKVVMDPTGHLILYNNNTGKAYWSSPVNENTDGADPSFHWYARFGGDWGLCITLVGAQNYPSWVNRQFPQQPFMKLTMQNDGNLVAYNPDVMLWQTNTSTGVQYINGVYPTTNLGVVSILNPGTFLTPGNQLVSPNGSTVLALQASGDLTLTRAGVVTWHSNTAGHANSWVTMQPDGNLALYPGDHWTTNGPPLWTSKSSGHPGASVEVQDDGNVAVYTWKAVWNSGTYGR